MTAVKKLLPSMLVYKEEVLKANKVFENLRKYAKT
jgi:hypothetical protein